MGKWILLATLVLLTGSICAQPNSDTLVLRGQALTVDEGLPQGLVLAMLQDRNGFMWFGTKDGLARYDGYEFKVFRNDPEDERSICGDRIIHLYEDSSGRIWVATENDGVCLFDPGTELFETVFDQKVLRIHEAKSGGFWLHAADSQVVFLNAMDTAFVPKKAAEQFKGWPALEHFKQMETDASGKLWLLTKNAVLVLEQNGQDNVTVLHEHSFSVDGMELPVGPGRPYKPALLKDVHNERFVLAYGDRLLSFPWSSAEMTLEQLPNAMIRSPEMIDSDGWLWYSDFQLSGSKVNLKDGRNEVVQILVPTKDPLLSEVKKQALLEDANGNIWYHSAGYGAFKVSRSARQFHHSDVFGPVLFHAQINPKRIERISLRPLNGSKDGIPEKVRERSKELNRRYNMLPQGMVDAFDRFWLVAQDGRLDTFALFVLDSTGAIAEVPFDYEYPEQVFPGFGNDVFVLGLNKAKPHHRQVQLLDPITFKAKARYDVPISLDGHDYWPVANWLLAPDKTIWMATNNGLLNLDPTNGNWQVYVNDEEDPTSLPSNTLFAVCLDPLEPDRSIWVGTEGAGMARLDKQTGKFKVYTTEHGLPNNVVYGILEDGKHLWLSTNQGLCRFDPKTEECKVFTIDHGLAGNEFNRYSAIKGPDGTMFFGGMAGMTYFHPDDFLNTTEPSPTILTSIRSMNKPIDHKSDPELIEAPVHSLKELRLPYDQRMITFSFANMDHTSPSDNQFRYRLEGLNEEWIENGTAHEATFTNLDPGNYTFQVQGRNGQGVWDEVGATLSLIITPPWWGTWWFRTAVVLVVIGLLYALYKYRLRRAMEVVKVRESIARDLHDEIGSTLSSLSLFSTVARNKVGSKAPEAAEMLDRITSNTTDMMEAMNDIVWSVDVKSDDATELFQRLRGYAMQMCESAGFQFDMSINEDLKKQSLSISQRKNVLMIFKEAVNNSIKYSNGNKLDVSFGKKGMSLEMEVRDNGTGFDPNAVPENGISGGNGIRNMHRRAEQMKGSLELSSSADGTAIVLQFKP